MQDPMQYALQSVGKYMPAYASSISYDRSNLMEEHTGVDATQRLGLNNKNNNKCSRSCLAFTFPMSSRFLQAQ